jgi:uncharacterized membrane protein YoaK (UPF0700 family)
MIDKEVCGERPRAAAPVRGRQRQGISATARPTATTGAGTFLGGAPHALAFLIPATVIRWRVFAHSFVAIALLRRHHTARRDQLTGHISERSTYPMAIPSPLGRRRTVAALLTLTVVTGLVDAVSYLRLGHVFVANMTGNVVFLGFSVDPHSGLSALASLIAIAGFVGGALAGGRAAHRLAAANPGRWLTAALAAEAVVLGVVAALTGIGVLPFTGHGDLVTIAVLAAALGVQNSTIRHLGVADLTTTVLTLTITGLAADSALVGGPGAKPHRRLGSIVAMLAGAAAGAGILQWSATAAIAIAAALVAAVTVLAIAEGAVKRPA